FLRPGLLVVLVARHQRRVDAVAGAEPAGAAGVLGGDHRRLPQHPQQAQGDVLQVADGRGADIKDAQGTSATSWWANSTTVSSSRRTRTRRARKSSPTTRPGPRSVWTRVPSRGSSARVST